MATTCKLIAKQTLGSAAATITFDNIPGTGTDLLLLLSARTTRTASVSDNPVIKFNSSNSGYTTRVLNGSGSGGTGSFTDTLIYGICCTNAATSNTFSNEAYYIPNYAGSTNKSVSVEAVQETNAAAAGMYAVAGLWSNTAAITRIDLTSYFGNNFTADTSAFLYQIVKA